MKDKKLCCVCKRWRMINEFTKDRRRNSGVRDYCKDCNRIYAEKYRSRPDVIERRKQYSHRLDVKERAKINQKNRRENNPVHCWVGQTISNHKNHGQVVKIPINELEEVAKKAKFCPFCNKELNWKAKSSSDNSPTLDRIDNETEMRMDNVMIICRECNMTKLDRTFLEFIKYCCSIAKRFGGEYR